MKAFISEINWSEDDAKLPKAAFLELPDNDLDTDEFCEVVDGMLLDRYKVQPEGWQWEIIDVTH